MVSISQQWSSPIVSYSKQKKRDITSLLGQMCSPAAVSASLRELGPIVSTGVWGVVGTCELPVAVVGGACLVMVHSTPGLHGGRGFMYRKRTR
jgi:hypothetical protein